MSAKEVAYRRMIIEGVLAIQSGANPRMLDDLLRSTLPPSERAAGEARKSA
jgi:chemotaxis protein MotA